MAHPTQRGFTLIELVITIVILGVLAAVALPRFVDLRADASLAAVQGVAGAAASAMSVNYAGCVAVNHATTDAAKCVRVTQCSDAGSLLQGGSLPPDYSVTALSPASSATNGAALSCRVLPATGTASATFAGIAAGN